ncbi:hypothetical protein DB30_00592 [Enhygromyxa salina]|uniref:Uncharacterized protein n=1 Tax=Enhygromyxa salina TaxID=215803 RepID=A0A0C2CTW3_9BACT|nr:hypothetical protein [Enhygromyxa salina]KIG13055.1 hypothetical protein DB30_00592 [Enhygromyxa salina]
MMFRNITVATLSLAICFVGPGVVARAAPATTEIVEGPALPGVEDEPGEDPLPDVGPADPKPEPKPEPAPEPASTADSPKPVEPPPPSMQQAIVVRVAVGLSQELDGGKTDKTLLDQLEASVAASPHPSADVRRLRVGSAAAKEICREGRDDLVITIGYVPDRSEPVLFTRDCLIEEELGIRSTAAAADPDLLGVLWAEHNDRIASGARERRRVRVSPKVRTGLIAGAAVAVIGVAVGLLIAGAVRKDTVVLVITPAN